MKVRVKAAEQEPVGTVVIDTVENDDWMKALPGYQNEVALHEQLAKNGVAEVVEGVM